MNVYASAASQRNGALQAGVGGEGPSQEIKYRQDAASYVAAMLAELRHIAGKAGFDKVVKSLDAAYYEAYAALDPKGIPAPASSPDEKKSKHVEPNGA